MGEPNDLIVQERRRPRSGPSVTGPFAEPARDFRATGSKSFRKNFDRVRGKLLAWLKRSESVGNRAAIDDRAAVVDVEEAHAPCSEASLLRRYSSSSASRGVRLSGSISPSAVATGSGPCSGSVAAAKSGKSSRPAAIPPVASRPASSLESTDRARATTAGGRPASLATAIP